MENDIQNLGEIIVILLMATKVQAFEEEQSETAEFYRIKLIERESQLSTLQASIRKIQFKHARELKEAKSQAERSKELLAQEKNKLDKVSKTAVQNQQQNTLLQQRLIDLKEEKQKEVESVRNKYNIIKQQVRQYQRILPTHTFINQLNATIEQLPTYEDIFTNSKEKDYQLQQLTLKYQSYQHETEQKLKSNYKNLEEVNKQKIQLENILKQVAIKQLQMENYIATELKKQQELRNNLYEKNQQIQLLKTKQLETNEYNKHLQEEINQMLHNHHVQIKSKQEQIQLLAVRQTEKYQQQISQIQFKFKQKIDNLLLQINGFQQENQDLQNKLVKERERSQQCLAQLRQEMEIIRTKGQQYLRNSEFIQMQNKQIINQMKILGQFNESNESKLQILKRQNLILKQKIQLCLKSQQNLIKDNQIEVNSLKQQIQNYKTKISQIQEINLNIENNNKQKQQTITQLQMELQQLKSIYQNSLNTFKLDKIPPQLQKKSRKPSVDYSVRSKNISVASNLEVVGCGVQTQQKITNGSLIQKISELQQKIKQQKIQLELAKQKIKQTQEKIFKQIFKNEQKSKSIQQLKIQLINCNSQLDKKNNQIKQYLITQKRIKLQLVQKSQEIQSARKKVLEFKENSQKFNTQKDKLCQEIKKISQNKEILSKKIKDLISENSQIKKQCEDLKKDLSLKNETINKQREQFQKQKKNAYFKQSEALTELKSLKIQQGKQLHQLNTLKKQYQEKQQLLKEKYNHLNSLKQEISKLNKIIQTNQQQKNLKDREIQILKDSLERQRKQRTLQNIPSLRKLQIDDSQQSFAKHYNIAGEKQGQIYLLERQVSDLKQQIQGLKKKYQLRISGLQIQQDQYIESIIKIKMKIAQSQMRALQKQHLYIQFKKKVQTRLGKKIQM